MWDLLETNSIGRIVVAPGVPAGFALFYTTRDFLGRLTPDLASSLTDVVRSHFGIESTLTTCNQVHGKSVRRSPRSPQWHECDSCDALFTDAPRSALAIKVADCLPVTLIDAEHRVIANIHSGWRGAAQGITGETIGTLLRETAFAPANAIAYLGPSIRACCFEVGEEVVAAFGADAERYVDRTHPKPHIDLAAMTTDVLRARGITRVHDSALCTRCEGSIFHSYRRDPKLGGRNLAIVAM
jgi:hypothetical protein